MKGILNTYLVAVQSTKVGSATVVYNENGTDIIRDIEECSLVIGSANGATLQDAINKIADGYELPTDILTGYQLATF